MSHNTPKQIQTTTAPTNAEKELRIEYYITQVDRIEKLVQGYLGSGQGYGVKGCRRTIIVACAHTLKGRDGMGLSGGTK